MKSEKSQREKTFSPGALTRLEEIKKKYPDKRAALMPALYIAQDEFGWLRPEALKAVAQYLELPEMTVRSTATFYSIYKHEQAGRNMVRLCTNVSCMVLGASTLKGTLETLYGLAPGGTSPDGRFQLEIGECIGACDRGPAMLVNDDLHTELDTKKLIQVLESYK